MGTDTHRLMRVVRQQSNALSLPAAVPSSVAEDTARNLAFTSENTLAFRSDEAFRAANEQVGNYPTADCEGRRGFNALSYPSSVDQDHVKIVLPTSKPKKIVDVVVPSTVTVIDEVMIFARKSCTDRHRLNPIGTAVSTAVEAPDADRISHGMVSKMDKDETFQLINRPEVKSIINAQLTRVNELMSSVATFVARSVKQEQNVSCTSRKRNPR